MSRISLAAHVVGEVVGGGSAEAGGDDHLVVSAVESDEPDLPGGTAFAAGAAVVDFDDRNLRPCSFTPRKGHDLRQLPAATAPQLRH